MRFEIDHVFTGISADDFVALYYDKEANEAMARHVKLQRELLSRDDDGTLITQKIRTYPERELPGVLRKAIRTDRIEYVETSTYNRHTGHGTWETIPNVLPSKVVTKGVFDIAALADDQVRRTVQGEISVKMALVGGTIEKLVVKNVKESIQRYNQFMQSWIDGKR